MEIFNIGIPELILIMVLLLILFGPDEIMTNARKVAQFIRKLIQSQTYREIRDTTREIQKIPQELIREAGLEEEIKQRPFSDVSIDPRSWTSAVPMNQPPQVEGLPAPEKPADPPASPPQPQG